MKLSATETDPAMTSSRAAKRQSLSLLLIGEMLQFFLNTGRERNGDVANWEIG